MWIIALLQFIIYVFPDKRHEWTEMEIRMLLDVVAENMGQLKNARNKTKVWSIISEQMQDKGIMVSSNQCLDKYKYLKKAYKSFVDRANKSDAGKCSFKYENEVHQIMGDDPAVKPKYTVDTELEESENGASCSKIAKSDAVAEEIQLDSSMKAKPERKPGMLKELQVMMEQRDTRLLDAMKNMQKEQNGLMKQLIDKLWMY